MAFPFYKIKSKNNAKKNNPNARQVVVVKGDYKTNPYKLTKKDKEQIEFAHVIATLGSYEFNNGNVTVIQFDFAEYKRHVKKGASTMKRVREIAHEFGCP